MSFDLIAVNSYKIGDHRIAEPQRLDPERRVDVGIAVLRGPHAGSRPGTSNQACSRSATSLATHPSSTGRPSP